MITTQELHRLFAEKLLETGSMDAALTKVTWVAYKEGVKDGQQGEIYDALSDGRL
jgi:hypothetical protein